MQHELKLQQERAHRDATLLRESHQEDLLKERRLFEATKIQLAHQVPLSLASLRSFISLCIPPNRQGRRRPRTRQALVSKSTKSKGCGWRQGGE